MFEKTQTTYLRIWSRNREWEQKEIVVVLFKFQRYFRISSAITGRWAEALPVPTQQRFVLNPEPTMM